MKTITTPSRAASPTFRTTTLKGGALSPRARRRAAPLIDTPAYTAITATRTIQLSVGLMFALTRL